MFALFSSIFDSCVSASNFLNTKILKFLPCFSGERPFICELCGNSYTDIKNLKKHKTKVHSGKSTCLDMHFSIVLDLSMMSYTFQHWILDLCLKVDVGS